MKAIEAIYIYLDNFSIIDPALFNLNSVLLFSTYSLNYPGEKCS